MEIHFHEIHIFNYADPTTRRKNYFFKSESEFLLNYVNPNIHISIFLKIKTMIIDWSRKYYIEYKSALYDTCFQQMNLNICENPRWIIRRECC